MRAVLTYHSLDQSGSPISVDPQVFRQQMAWLASGVVRVRSLSDLLGSPEGDDRDELALTFDDGFENFREVALPLLRELQLPATVFVVTGHVGGTNSWGGPSAAGSIPELPLMDWEALGQVAEAGVELGGHTVSHPRLPTLSLDRVEQEVAGCQEALARHTGMTASSFAYPYGEVTPQSASVVGRHFTVACSTELNYLGSQPDRLGVPRLDMYYLRECGQLEAWGSTRFHTLIWARRQGRRLRRLVSGGA